MTILFSFLNFYIKCQSLKIFLNTNFTTLVTYILQLINKVLKTKTILRKNFNLCRLKVRIILKNFNNHVIF